MSNELTKIIEEQSLIPTQAEFLLENFKTIFETAKKYELEAREIKVTDITQIDKMLKARELRLEIGKLRINADKVRTKLKENSLREGRAIQGFYNVIEALTKPLEAHLKDQEKFAEKIEEQKKELKAVERSSLLSKYTEESSLYNLRDMSEQGFQELLRASKIAYETTLETEKKAERERKEDEVKFKKEQKRIRLENAKLQKELDLKNKAEIEKNRLAKIESDKKQKEIDKANDNLKKVEDEIEADKKAKEEDEEKKRIEKKKAELAPDKEKLITLARELGLYKLPEVDSEEAKKVVFEVKDLMSKISIYIIKNSNNL